MTYRPGSEVRAAAALRAARSSLAAIAPFSDADDCLDESWGYAVQELDRRQRLEAGERVIGAKLGLTSEAKQRRMGVSRPIVGFLTDRMSTDPADLESARTGWIQPRIEPEIAFLTSRPIHGRLALASVDRVVEAVAVAAEVIDSRFLGYRFRLPDVVADNTSAAGVLVGAWRRPTDLDDLVAAECAVRVDDQLVHQATGAAILGDPRRALVLLSEHLVARGESLPAGSLVLAGALTDAVPLAVGGVYSLSIEGLGTIVARP